MSTFTHEILLALTHFMIKRTSYIPLTFLLLLPYFIFCQTFNDSLHHHLHHSTSKQKSVILLEIANAFLLSHADSSLHYAKQAKEWAKKENQAVELIRSYSLMGEAYQKLNFPKEALSSYFTGLRIAETANENGLAGTILNGIGTCFFYAGDMPKAEYYIRKAALAKEKANDFQYYAFISANLAAIQIMDHKLDQAINTLKQTENSLIKKKQDAYLATIYNSLGAAYQSKNHDSCIFYYEKCLAIAELNKDLLTQMTALQNIGDFYFFKKRYQEALSFMKKAMGVNDLRPEDQYKVNIYNRIASVFEAIGDYKNAFLYKSKEMDVHERLFSIAKEKEINELEIKYQSEKKEQQLARNKEEIAHAKTQRILLVFGFSALFLFTFGFFYFLLQKRKIKQQLEAEKLNILENIVHEIKAPLTLINGPIQILKEEAEPFQKEQLFLMERNAKKLIQLVEELLSASKIEKGTFINEHRIGNLSHFLEETLSFFSDEAKNNEQKFIYSSTLSNDNFVFPANSIEKILFNLVGNAFKYSLPNSTIKVNSYLNEQHLILQIQDNGPGILEKDQKKIFERFYRGQNSQFTSGTGIGLSMVKELIDVSKGKINFTSHSGGTFFEVQIPVSSSSVTNFQIEKEDTLPLLLLVEDDMDLAQFTCTILSNTFNIVHVSNGKTALAFLEDQLPSLILSDIVMPEMDGISLLENIRAREITNHLPVVLLSAKSALDTRLSSLSHGADAYLAKPFSPEELRLTLRNIQSRMDRIQASYLEQQQEKQYQVLNFQERVQNKHAYVNKCIEKVVCNIENSTYSVNELAEDLAVSRSQLHRKLIALTGYSTSHFIRMIRLEKAKDLLQNQEGNITEVAYLCGFSSQSYFTKTFTEHFGESPSKFQKTQ